jgi:hypothetical protein
MEDFNEMKQELFGLIDACIELENDNAWHFQFHWWRCNFPGFDWCNFYIHYPGLSVSFLLQFSHEEIANSMWQSDKWHRGDCNCLPLLPY